jgi:APA family basic amino acid/polyamine antiporter
MPDAVDHTVVPAGLIHATSRGKLLQVLGVSFGVAVIIGNTILVGILRTAGDVAAWLPSPAVFLAVWIIGGVYALLGAISMAEPGAMVAESGGQYVFVRRGLGEYPGSWVGWNDWISTCASVSLPGWVSDACSPPARSPDTKR